MNALPSRRSSDSQTRTAAAVGMCAVRVIGSLIALGTAWGCTEDTTRAARPLQDSASEARHEESRGEVQERFLYVTTIAQSASDPDFIAVVGADPSQSDYGTIVNRIDMPNVGDELHHFSYSLDRKRLVVPGLFSSRMHILEIQPDRKQMQVTAVNEDVASTSGYGVPHGVLPMSGGRLVAPMIGTNGFSQPGGIVQINDRTGAFESYFGPSPTRDSTDLGPHYMYHFDSRVDANRGISTTFGPPALCAPGIAPSCLGDEVAVWDVNRQKVIQVASLGAHSGALQVRFLGTPGVRRAFINTPGTSAVWLAYDDDKDGVFAFKQVLTPENGLQLPVDMVLSKDNRYLYITNWFGNTVQQFDVTDPFHPARRSTVAVPHANMMRLSPDNRRMYVSNSLLTTWDNDPNFGPPRNAQYGIWLFDVDPSTGRLTPTTDGGKPWISFANVLKKNSIGPAGPHMMLFDPGVRMAAGEH